jgi:aminomethyltransferase
VTLGEGNDGPEALSGIDRTAPRRTPLHDLHLALGGRMVPFGGYEMPLHYPLGILGEHLHTRAGVGFFDVSHMGQIRLIPRSGVLADAMSALERLVPVDVLGLSAGRQRYAMFTNEQGGILDDLIIANRADHLLLVVNATRKEADAELLRAGLADACDVALDAGRALFAIQGPKAEAVLTAVAPRAGAMRFMDVIDCDIAGVRCVVSRSGYTGEDGYEIGLPSTDAVQVAETLLAHPAMKPIGLGARDSLRQEAGLCLFGSDIDETTTPTEAALGWAIQKARRQGGSREGGFPGAGPILTQLADGVERIRVGLLPEGRAPVRAGATIVTSTGEAIGRVTSGCFGPSAGAPVAMGYVATAHSRPGTLLEADQRGRRLPVRVVDLPFVPHSYKR